MNIEIRLATVEDLQAIADIYNYEVHNSTATFDTRSVSLDERLQWLATHDPRRHPVTVAVSDDRIVGWACVSSWSERCAYARTGEVSVYVHHEQRRHGVGKALLSDLIERARAAGLGVLLARISSGEQASIRLHEAIGFQAIGTMHRVGDKFGRILDVELLEYHLDRA
jgi:phosphinothricin acetyltransferase